MITIVPDTNEVNEYVKEYIAYMGLSSCLESFDQESKNKKPQFKMPGKANPAPKLDELPRIYSILKNDPIKTKKD